MNTPRQPPLPKLKSASPTLRLHCHLPTLSSPSPAPSPLCFQPDQKGGEIAPVEEHPPPNYPTKNKCYFLHRPPYVHCPQTNSPPPTPLHFRCQITSSTKLSSLHPLPSTYLPPLCISLVRLDTISPPYVSQHHFPNKATLNSLNVLTLSPPSSFDKQTESKST